MGIKIIAENKKARFDYEIIETYEAGLVLLGTEVKSLRSQQVSLKDSYVSFQGEEAFLQGAYIAEYPQASHFNHNAERLRKLLLHKDEIKKIFSSIREKGFSCVPLKIYFKKGKAKVELALARGKQKGDKRESIKKRDVNRDLQRQIRRQRT
ncbi:MAG: SsrA-binding protein SmpB [Bdellovibrionaceae bacterium]|nr:SsrA-binding protein SmpB [Pseudobdellovibrionaceae bacterium]